LKTEHIQMSINRYFQNFMDSGVYKTEVFEKVK
jgi:hypothetical protein